jgi:hypothetical protein
VKLIIGRPGSGKTKTVVLKHLLSDFHHDLNVVLVPNTKTITTYFHFFFGKPEVDYPKPTRRPPFYIYISQENYCVRIFNKEDEKYKIYGKELCRSCPLFNPVIVEKLLLKSGHNYEISKYTSFLDENILKKLRLYEHLDEIPRRNIKIIRTTSLSPNLSDVLPLCMSFLLLKYKPKMTLTYFKKYYKKVPINVPKTLKGKISLKKEFSNERIIFSPLSEGIITVTFKSFFSLLGLLKRNPTVNVFIDEADQFLLQREIVQIPTFEELEKVKNLNKGSMFLSQLFEELNLYREALEAVRVTTVDFRQYKYKGEHTLYTEVKRSNNEIVETMYNLFRSKKVKLISLNGTLFKYYPYSNNINDLFEEGANIFLISATYPPRNYDMFYLSPDPYDFSETIFFDNNSTKNFFISEDQIENVEGLDIIRGREYVKLIPIDTPEEYSFLPDKDQTDLMSFYLNFIKGLNQKMILIFQNKQIITKYEPLIRKTLNITSQFTFSDGYIMSEKYFITWNNSKISRGINIEKLKRYESVMLVGSYLPAIYNVEVMNPEIYLSVFNLVQLVSRKIRLEIRNENTKHYILPIYVPKQLVEKIKKRINLLEWITAFTENE